jgi:hypothetical protein
MIFPQAVSDSAVAAKSKPAKTWAGRLLFFNVNHSKPSRDRSKVLQLSFLSIAKGVAGEVVSA